MSMAMDKPTKVEVGQRWKMRDGREMAVARYDAKFSPFPWRVFDETNCREDGLQDGFERNCTFLGWAFGFAPSPSSPGRPRMEANAMGFPVACLSCGGPLKRGQPYECGGCSSDGYAERTSAWRAGARDFPRPRSSSQGEPGGVLCNCKSPPCTCRKPVLESPRPTPAPTLCLQQDVSGGCVCSLATGHSGDHVALGVDGHEIKRWPLPAPVVTSKPAEFKPIGIDWGKDVPVKREVFAGGAWLDYERLTDPDPFHLYKRRRENGVEVAALEARGYGGLTFREAANRDGIASRIMKADDYGRSTLSSKPAALTSWLATDAKPPQGHPYSKPSSPGGGE